MLLRVVATIRPMESSERWGCGQECGRGSLHGDLFPRFCDRLVCLSAMLAVTVEHTLYIRCIFALLVRVVSVSPGKCNDARDPE